MRVRLLPRKMCFASRMAVSLPRGRHPCGVKAQRDRSREPAEPWVNRPRKGTSTVSMRSDTRSRGVRLPRSARRAQLLEAAQAVFVESGYHAAVMDDIADCAGVSKTVLYEHFRRKLDLYLALFDQHSGELLDLIRTALASTTENKQRVAATIGAYFEFVGRDGAPFRLVFESDLTNEAAVRERVDKMSQDSAAVSYTHLRAHETVLDLVCR